MKKAAACLSLLLIFVFVACQGERSGRDNPSGEHTVSTVIFTEIAFSDGETELFGNKYLFTTDGGYCEIFEINQKSAKIKSYWKIDGNFIALDYNAESNRALLGTTDELYLLELDEKKCHDITASVLTQTDLEDKNFDYRAVLLDNGKKIAVAKIVRDSMLPIKVNDITLGFELSPHCGIYVYSLEKPGKPTSLHNIRLEDMDMSCPTNNMLEFQIMEVGGNLAVIAQVQPHGAPYPNITWFTVNTADGSCKKTGDYLIKNNADTILKTAFMPLGFTASNSQKLVYADFDKGRTFEIPLEFEHRIRDIEFFAPKGEDFFVVRFVSETMDWYGKYAPSKDGLKYKEFTKEELNRLSYAKYAGNNVEFLLSAELSEKYGLTQRTVVTALGGNAYLAEVQNKAVILF